METSSDYWQAAGVGSLKLEELPSSNFTNVLGNRVIAPQMSIIVHGYSLASFCYLDARDTGQVSFVVNAVKGSTYEWSFDQNGKWLLM